MRNSFDLAEYLADHLSTRNEIRILEQGLQLLNRSSRPINPDNVVELTDSDLNSDVVRNFVIELERQGILGEALDQAELQIVTNTAIALIEHPPESPDKLVATIPNPEKVVDSTRFTPLLLGLRQLIKRAENRLILVSPFFHPRAIEKVSGPLGERVREGVNVDIVTRALTTDEPNFNNRQFLDRLLEDDMPMDGIRIYEYLDDETGTTLHTKLLAVDGVECYLGSANITHYGLANNLEIGIICRGRTGSALAATAREITRSYSSHQVEYSEGKFQRR